MAKKPNKQELKDRQDKWEEFLKDFEEEIRVEKQRDIYKNNEYAKGNELLNEIYPIKEQTQAEKDIEELFGYKPVTRPQ